MAAQNVFRYNKIGYCKFGQICRKQHIDELFGDTSCDPSKRMQVVLKSQKMKV